MTYGEKNRETERKYHRCARVFHCFPSSFLNMETYNMVRVAFVLASSFHQYSLIGGVRTLSETLTTAHRLSLACTPHSVFTLCGAPAKINNTIQREKSATCPLLLVYVEKCPSLMERVPHTVRCGLGSSFLPSLKAAPQKSSYPFIPLPLPAGVHRVSLPRTTPLFVHDAALSSPPSTPCLPPPPLPILQIFLRSRLPHMTCHDVRGFPPLLPCCKPQEFTTFQDGVS